MTSQHRQSQLDTSLCQSDCQLNLPDHQVFENGSLSVLANCFCTDDNCSSKIGESSSNRRKLKRPSDPSFSIEVRRADMLSQLKNNKPTLIDNLILRNKSALLHNQHKGRTSSSPVKSRRSLAGKPGNPETKTAMAVNPVKRTKVKSLIEQDMTDASSACSSNNSRNGSVERPGKDDKDPLKAKKRIIRRKQGILSLKGRSSARIHTSLRSGKRRRDEPSRDPARKAKPKLGKTLGSSKPSPVLPAEDISDPSEALNKSVQSPAPSKPDESSESPVNKCRKRKRRKHDSMVWIRKAKKRITTNPTPSADSSIVNFPCEDSVSDISFPREDTQDTEDQDDSIATVDNGPVKLELKEEISLDYIEVEEVKQEIKELEEPGMETTSMSSLSEDRSEVDGLTPFLKQELQNPKSLEPEALTISTELADKEPLPLDDSFELSLFVPEDEWASSQDQSRSSPPLKTPEECPQPQTNGDARSITPEITTEDQKLVELDEEKPPKSLEPAEEPDKPNEPEDSKVVKEEEDIQEIKSGEDSQESSPMKEEMLTALGLQSLSSPPPKKPVVKNLNAPPSSEPPEGYTGTLKAVIKLNRGADKKSRTMVYQRSQDKSEKLEYKMYSDPYPSTNGIPITHLADVVGARRMIPHKVSCLDPGCNSESVTPHPESTNSTALDSSAETSTEASDEHAGGKDLIIPEKSSSFSIHPGRLCSDVCSYCFGKFGSLDTPCHVAQLKGEDRQKKILENEPHLTPESCLCDACYRYVDRKANCTNLKTKVRKPPVASICCVTKCEALATHAVKRKWLLKLKRSISSKLDIDIDKPGSLLLPLCAEHHYWVEYYTVCGICRRRLNRNHLYSLGAETDRLNLVLAEDGIPARLTDKLFLCKLCRYYSNLRLKYTDPLSIPTASLTFYRTYRKRILMSLDVPISDSEEEGECEELHKDQDEPEGGKEEGMEDMMALSGLATLLDQPDPPSGQARIQVKFGNVNIGTLSNLNIGQGGVAGSRTPEEREPPIALSANFDFQGPASPDGSWEKVETTIQFDKKTKKLWQELQRPYGSQSSFLRHLVMLEKYWRMGYLVLAPDADSRAAKYITGVHNRLKAFGGPAREQDSGLGREVLKVPTVNTSKPEPSTSSSGIPKGVFPLLPTSGEVQVTPVMKPRPVAPGPAPAPVSAAPPRPIAPAPWTGGPTRKPSLDRQTALNMAKTLVRMAPPTGPRGPPGAPQGAPAGQQTNKPWPRPRPPFPPFRSTNPMVMSRVRAPPPLLKLTAPLARPRPPLAPLAPAQHLSRQAPPALPPPPQFPRLPRSLQVTQAITLPNSGITIEKHVGNGPIAPPSLVHEKPSITVFREPMP